MGLIQYLKEGCVISVGCFMVKAPWPLKSQTLVLNAWLSELPEVTLPGGQPLPLEVVRFSCGPLPVTLPAPVTLVWQSRVPSGAGASAAANNVFLPAGAPLGGVFSWLSQVEHRRAVFIFVFCRVKRNKESDLAEQITRDIYSKYKSFNREPLYIPPWFIVHWIVIFNWHVTSSFLGEKVLPRGDVVMVKS